MSDNPNTKLVVQRKERPVEFRTIMILYILLGLGVGLTIHFILLSTPTYNWLGG
jgi:hypothetical protein